MWYLNKIPKVVHFYWGNEKLSYLRYMSIFSFRKLNPDWTIKIHIPQKINNLVPSWDTFEQKNSQIKKNYWNKLEKLDVHVITHNPFDDFDNNAHEVHKSDFFRWKLLMDEGGVWSDFDIVYQNSMNNLLENVLENNETEVGLSWYPNLHKWAISFMLSSPQNKFFNQIHELSKGSYDKSRYQSIGSELINNHWHRPGRLIKGNPKTKFCLLNEKCVYPIGPGNIDNFYVEVRDESKEMLTDPNILGYHWFAGYPLSQKFENELDENNLNSFNNILATCIFNLREKYGN